MKGQKVLMLDKEDLLILNCLSSNCRMPYRKIGDKIGMTGEGVHKRIKLMRKRKYIRKFTIELSARAKLEIKYLRHSIISIEEEKIDEGYKEEAEKLGLNMVV